MMTDSSPKPPSGANYHRWLMAEAKRKVMHGKPLNTQERIVLLMEKEGISYDEASKRVEEAK